MITLRVEPRRILTWNEFCGQKPPYSVALDGYVRGPYQFQPESEGGPRVNFNHHEDVDRLSTLCTAAQVNVNLKSGFFECFTKRTSPHATIYANDPDQDVSTAVWLLRNSERKHDKFSEQRLETLLNILNALDITGGCYPVDPTSKTLREFDWVFEPYTNARMSGKLPQLNGKEMEDIINKISLRIDSYLLGTGGEAPIDVNYQKLGGGPGWTLVKETGYRARLKLANDGIRAFVSVINRREDGNWTYTIAKQSQYIPFPITEIYEFLNDFEQIEETTGWGGSNIIGGSPRAIGSSLSPKELERAINQFLKNKELAQARIF